MEQDEGPTERWIITIIERYLPTVLMGACLGLVFGGAMRRYIATFIVAYCVSAVSVLGMMMQECARSEPTSLNSGDAEGTVLAALLYPATLIALIASLPGWLLNYLLFDVPL